MCAMLQMVPANPAQQRASELTVLTELVKDFLPFLAYTGEGGQICTT